MTKNIILGLGSSCGNRLGYLRQAIRFLHEHPDITIQKVAPVYISDAHLPDNAKPEWRTYYLNSALLCSSTLSADIFLRTIKNIEQIIGRKPAERWAPRIIDIDILTFGAEKIIQENLVVPHQQILNRPFALWPLLDLQPRWHHAEFEKVLAEWGDKFSGKAPFATRQLTQQLVGPELVGIINVTPDSFSADGLDADISSAVQQVKQQFAEGASIIDIGAESTNPNSSALTSEQECQRLLPFLAALTDVWADSEFKPLISVDTYHTKTVEKILDYPVDIINDVSTRELVDIISLLKGSSKQYVFMHSLGVPVARGDNLPEHCDPVQEVLVWAQQTLNKLLRLGMSDNQLIFDPGIGFGNSPEQALTMLQRVNEFAELKLPIYIGHSRKKFINLFTNKIFADRDLETSMITSYLATKKVDYLRVHNVAVNNQAIKIAQALQFHNTVNTKIEHEALVI
jgi:2-amino-4-hydroxy-6-hydroxymethyldihydropteridine diphosphokinase/dihydropteroate synthase